MSYKVLNILEFTSDRARMSVIVQTPEGKIIVFSKGADAVMLKRMHKWDTKLIEKTKKHINKFSKLGRIV